MRVVPPKRRRRSEASLLEDLRFSFTELIPVLSVSGKLLPWWEEGHGGSVFLVTPWLTWSG